MPRSRRSRQSRQSRRYQRRQHQRQEEKRRRERKRRSQYWTVCRSRPRTLDQIGSARKQPHIRSLNRNQCTWSWLRNPWVPRMPDPNRANLPECKPMSNPLSQEARTTCPTGTSAPMGSGYAGLVIETRTPSV